MLTARARVPATCMACVGGPAVGRGARRRRDLLRRSATSAPTRLLPRLLPRLDRLRALGGTKARTETRRTPTMRQKSSVLTTSHHRRAIRPRHLPKLPTLPQSGTRLKLPSAAGWSGRQLVRRRGRKSSARQSKWFRRQHVERRNGVPAPRSVLLQCTSSQWRSLLRQRRRRQQSAPSRPPGVPLLRGEGCAAVQKEAEARQRVQVDAEAQHAAKASAADAALDPLELCGPTIGDPSRRQQRPAHRGGSCRACRTWATRSRTATDWASVLS